MYSAPDPLNTAESPPDEWFFASEQAPRHVPVEDRFGGGEIPFVDPYLSSFLGMIENLGSISDLPPVPGSSPNYTDPKNFSASPPSDDGFSPVLDFLSAYSWDIEEDCPVAVTGSTLIMKLEDENVHTEQFTTKQEDLYEDMNLASQAFEQVPGLQAEFTSELPLDLFSLGSSNLMSLPSKKICRGRRVPTVEIIEEINRKTNYTKPKGGTDAFVERRFACGYVDCRKCFKRREHLVRHQRSAHSSEKPFKCPVDDCDFSCNRKDNMHQHIRNAHCKTRRM